VEEIILSRNQMVVVFVESGIWQRQIRLIFVRLMQILQNGSGKFVRGNIDSFIIASLENEIGKIGLSHFLQFRSVFCPTHAVGVVVFIPLRSIHTTTKYFLARAVILPALAPPQKTSLHGKKRASPSVVAWLRGKQYQK